MDITTECLRAVDLGEQSAQWSLDTLTTFSVTNKYAREYVIGAYMASHPRADVAKVAEACGLTWSLSGTKVRCKSLENYRKFYTTVGEIAEGNAIPLADALAMLARDRADERSKARRATADKVREMLANAPEPAPDNEVPDEESAFPEPEPEPVDLLTGESIPVPAPTAESTVTLPLSLVREIMDALRSAEQRPALAELVDRFVAEQTATV